MNQNNFNEQFIRIQKINIIENTSEFNFVYCHMNNYILQFEYPLKKNIEPIYNPFLDKTII